MVFPIGKIFLSAEKVILLILNVIMHHDAPKVGQIM